MTLTNAAVKAARPRDRAYKMADERGLFLFVAPTGLKSLRIKYRFGRKEKLLVLGSWPELSLAEARARCDAAREQLRNGVDPAAARRRSHTDHLVAGNNFESVARAWHAMRAPRWTPVHADDVLASLERDAFPPIGATPIGDLDEQQLLELLQSIEDRGCIETARRLAQRFGGIFAYAKRKKLVADNPATDLHEELKPRPPARNHPAIVDELGARALLEATSLRNAASIAAPIIKLAHRFLALTAVRQDALRGARWEEIEDLDGPTPLWRVPAARMKLAAAKKAEARFAHLVPLSAAAVEVLREADRFAGTGKAIGLIFPGRGGSRPIGEAAIGDLIARAGYQGRHVPHGWRASFSTILNERMPAERQAIDEALAHVVKGGTEGAYNRAEQLERRRRLFDAWAEILCGGAAGEAA